MPNRARLPSTRRRCYPNNSKQARLGISSPNGYSSMVLCTGKLAVCLGAVRTQRLLRCAASKTHARSHYLVPWRFIVAASLSSQSKSNSRIPGQARLCGWRGFFPPILGNHRWSEKNEWSHLILFLWEGYCIIWASERELGPRHVSECLRNLEPEDAITAGFLLCSFSRQGWRTQRLISMWPADPVLSHEGWSLLKRQCWNAFARVVSALGIHGHFCL